MHLERTKSNLQDHFTGENELDIICWILVRCWSSTLEILQHLLWAVWPLSVNGQLGPSFKCFSHPNKSIKRYTRLLLLINPPFSQLNKHQERNTRPTGLCESFISFGQCWTYICIYIKWSQILRPDTKNAIFGCPKFKWCTKRHFQFACEQCNYSCKQSNQLKKHMWKHIALQKLKKRKNKKQETGFVCFSWTTLDFQLSYATTFL